MPLPKFALHDLGWRDFQQLCHTVLREVLGQTVESFLDSNDAGRDGAFAGTWRPNEGSMLAGKFVIQCKHTSRPASNLAWSDVADEIGKAGRLVEHGLCDVYILMTNAGVSGRIESRITSALTDAGVRDVLVFGSDWLDQTIVESSRLRRLVPRLYGLGDLTQILDDRAYRQAQAVLDAMRTDLAKLVLTSTYERAAQTLDMNGFVLLLGAPATGKTTIAAQLSLGAADAFETSVVKIDSIEQLTDRWNPEEKQLFWLDDAFGATQFDRSLAADWATQIPRITSAMGRGSKFVITSRDYIYNAARGYLKRGSFPLLNEAQVVIDVSVLSPAERRQILYNHLRHGRQPNSVVAAMRPHLELVADHPGFTPELARRMADPVFTKSLTEPIHAYLESFLANPIDLLREVMEGLDDDSRAALGLVFVNKGFLPSPLRLSPTDSDLLERLNSGVGGVISSLNSMSGSLVQHVQREGQGGWIFAHPTMLDSYSELLRSPDLLDHLLTGFPLHVLLSQVSCGDVGVQGAIVVPQSSYGLVLDRLGERAPKGLLKQRHFDRRRRLRFLSTRCDAAFLADWLTRNPEWLSRHASPGLMLDLHASNELFVRMHDLGLVPEDLRRTFASHLIHYAVTGQDASALWSDRLQPILTADEKETLFNRVKTELLEDLPGLNEDCTWGWDSESSPEERIDPLRTLAYELPTCYPDDGFVAVRAAELVDLLDEWVGAQEWAEPEQPERPNLKSPALPGRSESGPTIKQRRSVFDDIVDGRHSDQHASLQG